MDTISVMALADKIRTEGDAYAYIEQLRWGDQPVCPHCGSTERISFLTPANGVSRKTRTGAVSERRVWFCGACRKQFTALVGTIFHGTKVSLRKWLFVTYEMCANKNGIAAREIQRKYEVTAKTAWFMTQRLREAMKRPAFIEAMSGNVVADETWIGGSTGNKHRQGKPKPYSKSGSGKRPNPFDGKTAVLSLIDTDTGEVRSQVVPNIKGDTLRQAIAEEVDMPNTRLLTDAAGSYKKIAGEFYDHRYVSHEDNEYVRRDRDGVVVTTNAAEGFFAQLKRSIDGTHHHVSGKHLHRYLAEFDYRYNTRDLTDTARTQRLFGQVGGRRLAYRPLAGG